MSSAIVSRDLTSHFGSSQQRRSLISFTGDASDHSSEVKSLVPNKSSDEPTIFDVLQVTVACDGNVAAMND